MRPRDSCPQGWLETFAGRLRPRNPNKAQVSKCLITTPPKTGQYWRTNSPKKICFEMQVATALPGRILVVKDPRPGNPEGDARQHPIECPQAPPERQQQMSSQHTIETPGTLLFGEGVCEIALGSSREDGHAGERRPEWDIDLCFGIHSPSVRVRDWTEVPLPQFEPRHHHRRPRDEQDDPEDSEGHRPAAGEVAEIANILARRVGLQDSACATFRPVSPQGSMRLGRPKKI